MLFSYPPPVFFVKEEFYEKEDHILSIMFKKRKKEDFRAGFR